MHAEQQARVAPAFFLAVMLAVAPLTIRGRQQSVHLYGEAGHPTILLLSGDGGWMHVAPHVATKLAESGYYVIGVDARDYLEGFTGSTATLSTADVQKDVAAMVAFATTTGGSKPVLAGVSEGAGLAVIAAGARPVQVAVSGVLAIGLPSQTELGWRWRDAVIYFTHAAPKEPLVAMTNIIRLVSPVPLAIIHSAKDEYTPLAEATALVGSAGEPKKLWIIAAADHRFSDNLKDLDQRVLDAMAWISRGGR